MISKFINVVYVYIHHPWIMKLAKSIMVSIRSRQLEASTEPQNFSIWLLYLKQTIQNLKTHKLSSSVVCFFISMSSSPVLPISSRWNFVRNKLPVTKVTKDGSREDVHKPRTSLTSPSEWKLFRRNPETSVVEGWWSIVGLQHVFKLTHNL